MPLVHAIVFWFFPRPGEFVKLQGGECDGGDHQAAQQHRHDKEVGVAVIA